MKKMLIPLTLVLFLTFSVMSLSSQDKIDHISEIIFEDCQGNDILFNSNFAARAEAFRRLANKENASAINQEPIYQKLLDWPYQVENIANQIVEIDKVPWDELSRGFFMGGGISGDKFLVCGNNYLTISKDEYYWNNIKIDTPKEEFNSYYAQNLADNGVVIAGENNQVNQENKNILINLFWSQGTLGGAVLTIIFGGAVWVLKRMAYDKIRERKKIRIDVEFGFTDRDGKISENLLLITAINYGKEPVHLSSFGLRSNEGNLIKLKEINLPSELKPG